MIDDNKEGKSIYNLNACFLIFYTYFFLNGQDTATATKYIQYRNY